MMEEVEHRDGEVSQESSVAEEETACRVRRHQNCLICCVDATSCSCSGNSQLYSKVINPSPVTK